jgi:hypothetical protein
LTGASSHSSTLTANISLTLLLSQVVEKGMAVQAPGFAEDKIGAALAAVKALNPNISGVFYYNSAMDWPVSRHIVRFRLVVLFCCLLPVACCQ